MKNSHVDKCETVLKSIMKDPLSKLFLKCTRYDVSYYSIHNSLQPIDLSKVKERLDRHLYDSMDQFALDLCSVFSISNVKKLSISDISVCRKMLKKINLGMRRVAASYCHKWMYSLRNIRKHSKVCKYAINESNDKGVREENKIESEEDERDDKNECDEKDEDNEEDDDEEEEVKGSNEIRCFFKECDCEIKDDKMIEHNSNHVKCLNAIEKTEMKDKYISMDNFEENFDVCEFKNKLKEKWAKKNSVINEMNKKKLAYHPELKCSDNSNKWIWPYSISPLSLHYIE